MVKQQTQKELVDELTNKMNESIKNYKNDPSEELKFLDFRLFLLCSSKSHKRKLG